jgi:hypothetical protein
MSYMIFEIQEGNLVLTDPNYKFTGRKPDYKREFMKQADKDSEDYIDYVTDLGCWEEDDSIDLEEAFI